MKILVTGSSGTIGSEMVEGLEKAGCDVWGLDKKQPQFTHPKHFIHHDLTKPLENLEWFDLIIHLAANARVHDLVIDPTLAQDNITMVFNILEYARKTETPKFIFASSREIYGNGNEMPVKESVGSQRTSESPYASSKLAGESYCYSYAKCYGIDTKIVRFSNVYGKYDFSNRFIPKTIRNLKANRDVEIWGKDKVLDFTYIVDAVSGVFKLIDMWPNSIEYNIAYGKGYTLISVAERLKELLSSKSKIVIKETKVGEVTEYTANIAKMLDLDWKPQFPIEQGINLAINYYETHNGNSSK